MLGYFGSNDILVYDLEYLHILFIIYSLYVNI